MKNKYILLTILMASILTACTPNAQKESSNAELRPSVVSSNSVSEEPSSEKKKDEVAADFGGAKGITKNESGEEDDLDSEEKTNSLGIKIDENALKKMREYLVEFGKFDEDFASPLSDDELKKVYEEAVKLSEDTGYWDIKDFVFQSLANSNEGKSQKFPLDYIDEVSNWKKSKKDEITDKFNDERSGFISKGAPKEQVDELTDLQIEDAMHSAYKKNPELLYDGYITEGLNILRKNKVLNYEDQAEESEDASEESSNKYADLRKDLVNLYGFSQEAVDKISDSDIDEAFSIANKNLQSSGFGDIGLMLKELGKMYPGSSSMYPGE